MLFIFSCIHCSCLQEDGIIEEYFVIRCYTVLSFAWRLVLYAWLGTLQVSALVLAFKTRNVKIDVLNDSKEISAIVYFTTLFVIEIIIFSAVLNPYNNFLAFFYYGGVLVAANVFLALVFIPKVLYRASSWLYLILE